MSSWIGEVQELPPFPWVQCPPWIWHLPWVHAFSRSGDSLGAALSLDLVPSLVNPMPGYSFLLGLLLWVWCLPWMNCLPGVSHPELFHPLLRAESPLL